MKTQPSLFVSHGSPMFAVEPGVLGPKLFSLGQTLSDIQAILVVSAHWETRDLRVSVSPSPATIHDFGGFPAHLYTLAYPAQGHPVMARKAAKLLEEAGFPVTLDGSQGLDHGAWVPLLHMFPDANVPVFQVSLPNDLTASGALEIGRVIAPMRQAGVLIVASGSMTHNLREVFSDVSDPDYAQEFTDWINAAVLRRDTEALRDYRSQAPHARRAHPSEEHFLPLLVAYGASGDDDHPEIVDGDMTHKVLSMDSILFHRATAESSTDATQPSFS